MRPQLRSASIDGSIGVVVGSSVGASVGVVVSVSVGGSVGAGSSPYRPSTHCLVLDRKHLNRRDQSGT